MKSVFRALDPTYWRARILAWSDQTFLKSFWKSWCDPKDSPGFKMLSRFKTEIGKWFNLKPNLVFLLLNFKIDFLVKWTSTLLIYFSILELAVALVCLQFVFYNEVCKNGLGLFMLINSWCALSLDYQHHPAIYWAKSMLWEHSSLWDICVYSQNGWPWGKS